MIKEIHTKEVDIVMHYSEDLTGTKGKESVGLSIMAKGDLKHHVIEGIVDVLKEIQSDNPHLQELKKED